ncbi:MAG: O-antigen ligase family protein, partial [Bacteroidia bacterium]|nr:O-antigen ligase family protein [Bacteroidia bacterium]
NTISQKYLFYVFLVSVIIGFIGLWFSPFLVSLSTGIIALSVLPYFSQIWSNHKKLVIVFTGILLLSLFDFLRTEDSSIVSAKLMLVIGFIFLQFASLYHFKNKKKEMLWLVIIFAAIVLVINCIAVGNYWVNKAYYDEMLLQSKAIPVLRMHHIHFGIINGIMLIMLGGVFIKKMLTSLQEKLVIIFFIGILIGFHILGSRTGLLSFYVASIVGLFIYSLDTKKYSTLLIGTVMIMAVLSGAYALSTSFKNKISNSMEDFNSWSNGEDINYKSMAMRLEAYKACIGIIKEHPLIGVGSGNQEAELQLMYEKENSVLFKENRVGPHNQILEFGIKYGILGIVLILAYFLYFFQGVNLRDYIYIMILVMLFTSIQFESLLERQGSIYFSTILIGLAYHLFYKNENIIQE